LRYSILVCVSVFFVSCMTEPSRNRGSLSDAMGKARDDNHGSRSVPDRQRPSEPVYPHSNDNPWDQNDNADSGRNASASNDGGGTVSAGPDVFWVSVRSGKDQKPCRSMSSRLDGDVLVGSPLTDNFEANIYGGFKTVSPLDDSSLDASVRDPLVFLKAGLEFRYLPVPKLRFMCPYLSLGVGAYVMMWEFENALKAGGETIGNDSLTGMQMSAGIGVYPVRMPKFRAGVSLTAEAFLFAPATNQGFDNDYFPYYSALKLAFEITPVILGSGTY